MKLRQIMIPLAAFAITATGASAFSGSDWLNKTNLNLSTTEISALTKAEEIREAARAQAEQVLKDAGIDKAKMAEIHKAKKLVMLASHEAIHEAVEAADYTAFKEAIKDTPMADKISTEADFQKLVEAYGLKESGDMEGAKEIMSELGIEGFRGGHGMKGMGGGFGGPGLRTDRQSAEAN